MFVYKFAICVSNVALSENWLKLRDCNAKRSMRQVTSHFIEMIVLIEVKLNVLTKIAQSPRQAIMGKGI